MSLQSAQSFLERLPQDGSLRQAVAKAGEGPVTVVVERLVALGAERGLSFTATDLQAAYEERHRAGGQGELSDADLGGVVGGAEGFFAWAVRLIRESKRDSERESQALNYLQPRYPG